MAAYSWRVGVGVQRRQMVHNPYYGGVPKAYHLLY